MFKQSITTEDCENYLKRLSYPGGDLLLESTGDGMSLNNNKIKERIEVSANFIGKKADENHLFKTLLTQLQGEVKRSGPDLLHQVLLKDIKALNNSAGAALLLEAIVMTDGSRPSFLIRNDQPDLNSNPGGGWEGQILTNSDLLSEAISCVGRIESSQNPDIYFGTGFLIANDLIMTNLHVLEEFAVLLSGTGWLFKTSVQINFGREHSGATEKKLRTIESVVFWGRPIAGYGRLDLVLLKLAPADPVSLPARLITPTSTGPAKGDIIYSVGYPGPPHPGDYQRAVINLLFADGYGHKRLAPGIVQFPPKAFCPVSISHDATTLGGNSGSPVLLANSCLNATGLHYAGIPMQANLAHALAEVRDLPGNPSGKLLNEIFKDYGI